jgi:hypothetical protein
MGARESTGSTEYFGPINAPCPQAPDRAASPIKQIKHCSGASEHSTSCVGRAIVFVVIRNEIVEDMQTSRAATYKPTRFRRNPPGIDDRMSAGRRYKNLIAELANDLGGKDVLSAAELGLVRQAAAISLQSEALQAALIRGEPVDSDALIRLSSEARRIMGCLKRAQPAVGPSPEDIDAAA